MNNICLIINKNANKVILDFKNNTFDLNNKKYEFYFDNIDKLVVYDLDIFYTDDSYLFFNKNDDKISFKKIFLIHNEWNDQIIINYNNNLLRRINYDTEYGNFEIKDDQLIIYWNYWGKEVFIKYDDYTYIQNEYKFLKDCGEINEYKSKCPIHIFIHICMLEDWKEIFLELLNKIKNSGLYDVVEIIHLGILGSTNNLTSEFFKTHIYNDPKIIIGYIDSRIDLYEIPSINYMKSYCDSIENDMYILYIHTKGVRNAGNKKVTESWRNMMTYFLIENYEEILKNMDYFDAVGNNIINLHDNNRCFINPAHTLHYSGNYWWSKKSHINKLPYISIDFNNNIHIQRYKAENWILSNHPNMIIGVLFQDDTNTHPYHRYVFEYYRNKKFLLISYIYK
jgi:hypothetical protein